MNTGFLGTLALSGGDWVIYFLLLASVLSGAILIERAIFLSKEEKHFKSLRRAVLRHLEEDVAALEKTLQSHPGSCSRILRAGFSQAKHGAASVEDLLVSASLDEKSTLENRLMILGTLGNNAPFIGLFGTVLGVIKAFHDLAESGAGPEVVMKGLSEALIATAVGLFVAIPCVIGFNYFTKKVKDLLSGTESLGRVLLAHIRSRS